MERVMPKNFAAVGFACALMLLSWQSLSEGNKVSLLLGTGTYVIAVSLLLFFLWSETSNFKDINKLKWNRVFIVLCVGSCFVSVPLSVFLIMAHFIYMLFLNASEKNDFLIKRPDIKRKDMINVYLWAIATLIFGTGIFVHYISKFVTPVM